MLSDFTLSTVSVDLSGGGPQTISFSLQSDSLALEGEEQFQIRLTPLSASLERNEFIDDTINVTIIDNDGKYVHRVVSRFKVC